MATAALLCAPLSCGSADGDQAGAENANSEPAVLVFVGDVMFDGVVEEDLRAQGLPFQTVMVPTREYIQGADLALFNLESAVSSVGEPIDKPFTFNSDVEALRAVAWAGFDVANLANNHVLDYGADALAETVMNLEAAGLRHIGITRQNEPQNPVLWEVGGLRIGVLGYADAEAPFAYAQEYFAFDTRPARADEALIARDLDALASGVDVIVVSVHWGIEGEPVTPRQRELGHFLIDRGAAVVVGHHPHVQQDAEWYRGGFIIYSLGNFVFGMSSDPRYLESRLFRVLVDSAGVASAELLALELQAGTWTPTPVSGRFEPVGP